jgi:PAS domain-containing protein
MSLTQFSNSAGSFAATASAAAPVTVTPKTTEAEAKEPNPQFDFTKRKGWGDLLVTQLAEAVQFILSPEGQVLYCSPSVTEILGWHDEELLEKDFVTGLVVGASNFALLSAFISADNDSLQMMIKSI